MGKFFLFAVAAATAVVVAASASAAPRSFTHATGEIWMSGPSQYMAFSAFDFGADSPMDRGTVTYTNFDYPGGLSYTAPVLCATVDDGAGTAIFMFQIPSGFPGLSGLYVVASVTDDGSPGAGNDTYGHTATTSFTDANMWCEDGVAVADYAITAGNLVVH